MFFFSRSKQSDPVHEFWNYFIKNQQKLFDLNITSAPDKKLMEIQSKLKSVHPDLAFEIGQTKKGKRDFIISAGGIRAALPLVEQIIDTAPQLPHWSFICCRPRMSKVMSICFDEGSIINPTDVFFELLNKDPQWLDINLYFRGFNNDKHEIFGQAGFLMLDMAIGEYAVMKRVRSVEFLALVNSKTNLKPINELAVEYDHIIGQN